MIHKDVIIIGAGAAGMMTGIESGKRGRNTLILEHTAKPGKKIIISGGGRCNFTNLEANPRENYLSENKHFCISAMKRYTQWDFLDLIEKHEILIMRRNSVNNSAITQPKTSLKCSCLNSKMQEQNFNVIPK